MLVLSHNVHIRFLPPDKFIQIAEESGDMLKIGDFIMFTSLSAIAKLNENLVNQITLSLNISIKQFLQNSFISHLKGYLNRTNFNPKNLIIEVTETLFIDDIVGIKEILKEIKSMGIRVSLDDFGTGYSSMSLLTKLPIDELKIDKSFIEDINDDENSKAMVEGIVALSNKMELSVVAEGIEHAEQMNTLLNLGCLIFQGYYFFKPLSFQDLSKSLEYKSI